MTHTYSCHAKPGYLVTRGCDCMESNWKSLQRNLDMMSVLETKCIVNSLATGHSG